MPNGEKKKKDKVQDKRIARLEKLVAMEEMKWSIASRFNATDGTAIPLNTAATPISMTNIAGGDGAQQRDGNQIIVKSLHYRALVTCTNVNLQYARFIVFYWKGDNAPTLADVFNFAVGAGLADATVDAPIGFYLTNDKKLTIYEDRIFPLEGDGDFYGPRTKFLEWKKSFKIGKQEIYSDTAAGDKYQGFYYMLMGSAAANMTASDSCYVTYKDN